MNFRIDLPGPEIWVSRGGRGILNVEPWGDLFLPTLSSNLLQIVCKSIDHTQFFDQKHEGLDDTRRVDLQA